MLDSIATYILSKLTAWLMAEGLARFHAAEDTANMEKDIDSKLAAFKTAYKNAFDGTAVTDAQKAQLKNSISNFIKPTSGGL